jgi:DNA polymerase I-like protein with 3'-5' exonuclease and polymerase domains
MYKIYSKIDLFNVTGRMNFIEPSMQNIPRDFDISTDKVSEISSDSDDISNLNKNEQIDEEFQFLLDKINDDDSNKDQMQTKSSSNISIRNAFIAGENKILLSADYSNLEFRIMANLCKDESLISIFNDSKTDVFVALASKWLKLEPKEIDEDKRQNVKKVI